MAEAIVRKPVRFDRGESRRADRMPEWRQSYLPVVVVGPRSELIDLTLPPERARR